MTTEPTRPPGGPPDLPAPTTDDQRAVATLDLLVDHVQETAELIHRQLDSMGAVGDRLYFTLGVLLEGAGELRSRLDRLGVEVDIDAGDAVRCECGDVLDAEHMPEHQTTHHSPGGVS